MVDGRVITPTLEPILISLWVSDAAGTRSDTADLELDDTDGRIALPEVGAEVAISLGWDGAGMAQVFRGKVDEVRGSGSRSGRTLRVSAKGLDTKSKVKEPQEKHIDKAKVKDALAKAGEAAGISDVKVDADLASIERDYWVLDGESFLAFGQRVAREVGGTFKIQGSKASLSKRNGGKSPSGEEMPTVTATWGDNLQSYDIAPILGRPRFKKTRARYYDKKEAKWKEVEAEVEDDDIEPTLTRRMSSADEGEAKGHADDDKASTEAAKGGGNVTIEGNVQARPEGTCILAGCRPGIDGTYKIETVEHEYSRSGWTTQLSLKNPAGEAGKDKRKTKGKGKTGSSSTITGTAPPDVDATF